MDAAAPGGAGNRKALAVAVLLLGAAFLLRTWDLGDLRAGFYQDESVSGLQAADLLRGTNESGQFAPRMMFPLWTLLVSPFVLLMGMVPLAVRLPAALAGTASVLLAFILGRRLAGLLGGALAGGFLAFSSWHLIYSRAGVSPVLVPLQGLALVLLATGRTPSPRRDGFLAGLVAGSGMLSYFAGWSLIPALALMVAVRAWGDTEFRPRAARFAAWSLLGCAAVMAVFLAFPSGIWLGGLLVHSEPGAALAGMGRHLAGLFLPGAPDVRPGFWGVYPPGAPLLSPPAAAVMLCGLASLMAGGTARWLVVLASAWVVAGLLPAAALPEGMRFSRSIGVLAPVAMLSGLAARNLRAFLPRAAPAIVAALLAFQAAASAWNYFGVYRRDPRVYVWANIVDVEMAQYVRSRAAETGVVLINPDFPSATLKFLAAGDIRAGRIAFRPARHPGLVFVTQFREPVSQQPLLFVFHAPELEGTGAAALLILNPAGVLGPASNEAAAGRWEAAAGRYREALDMFPDLALGHLRYAQVLERLGSRREAAAERLTARRLGLDREP